MTQPRMGWIRNVYWLIGWFDHASERHRSRVALNELDARLLDDVGISPAEARREVSRPFWK